jgi:drug/metabolite transporter (DMT)-like permease
MQFPALNSAALGSIAGGAWGVGDFSGGLAARRANVFGVVVVAYSVGFLAMLAMALGRREPFPPATSFLWSALAGIIGGLALAAFYAALAQGKMGITAAVAAVLTAALPVISAAVTEGMPRKLQMLGFGLAIVALWLVSRPQEAGRPHGLGLALLSGVGFGAYLILIRRAGADAVYWPLATSRAASVLAALLFSLPLKRFRAPGKRVLWLCAIAGAFDVSGVAFFVIATRVGRLDVAAVLSSLYPAVTVILARVLLKEHMTVSQRWGMLTALASVALIAA